MTNKYSITSSVTLYDAGPGGTIKIPVLFNYFQGVTGAHANSIGFGGSDILRKGYSWVISRYRLSVLKLPSLYDKFTITTWRSGENGYFAVREFIVTDEEKNILMQATSSWMLMNIFKMVPVKPSDLFPGYPMNSERALDDKFPPISEISRIEYEKEFSVRKSDLDMNRHVNNSVYTSWIIETGEDINGEKALKDIVINFKSETRYGENVISQASGNKEDGRIIHRLIGKNSGKELTRGITEWQ